MSDSMMRKLALSIAVERWGSASLVENGRSINYKFKTSSDPSSVTQLKEHIKKRNR